MSGGPAHPKDSTVLDWWRVGLVAYRYAARAELHHHHCWIAGHEAMRAAYPELSLEQARLEMRDALTWAASNHNEWLHRGVPRREWIWPPDHRGVGHYRHPKREA